MRTSVAVGLIVASAMATGYLNERFVEDRAIEQFDATLAAANEGANLDLTKAFGLPWDRAAVIEGYAPGWVANELLGFRAYGDYQDLAIGDGAQWLVFARNGHVVADFVIGYEPHAYFFAASRLRLTPDDATFRVQRVDGYAELNHAEAADG